MHVKAALNNNKGERQLALYDCSSPITLMTVYVQLYIHARTYNTISSTVTCTKSHMAQIS